MHRPAPHIVLLEPEIPWNTGNAGRSCLAFDAQLHLVGPMGFRLDQRSVRRAGLDYWDAVKPSVWVDWPHFEAEVMSPQVSHTNQAGGTIYSVTADATLSLWEVDLRGSPLFLFGKESRGLPEPIRMRFPGFHIPMPGSEVRSLNVSTCVGIVLTEWLRQNSKARTRPRAIEP